jgi:hypothetical protein
MILLRRFLVDLTLAAHGSQKLFGFFGGSGPAGTPRGVCTRGRSRA